MSRPHSRLLFGLAPIGLPLFGDLVMAPRFARSGVCLGLEGLTRADLGRGLEVGRSAELGGGIEVILDVAVEEGRLGPRRGVVLAHVWPAGSFPVVEEFAIIVLRRSSHRSQSLALEAVDLGGVRSPAALQLEMLTDRVV
jgi:hypothetical protein